MFASLNWRSERSQADLVSKFKDRLSSSFPKPNRPSSLETTLTHRTHQLCFHSNGHSLKMDEFATGVQYAVDENTLRDREGNAQNEHRPDTQRRQQPTQQEGDTSSRARAIRDGLVRAVSLQDKMLEKYIPTRKGSNTVAPTNTHAGCLPRWSRWKFRRVTSRRRFSQIARRFPLL